MSVHRVHMGILAQETAIKDWSFKLTFDGNYHTFWIKAHDESWEMTFDFHDKQAPKVLEELQGVVAALGRYVEGDVGGPTPETQSKRESERRAKVARCSHGFIHSAHAYTVGDAKGEAEAEEWVRKGSVDYEIIGDVSIDDVILGQCSRNHTG